jgi:hypothetical protein
VRSHLSARMLAEELAALRAAVSSTAELVLGCSHGETSRVEIMNELTAKFGGYRNFACGLRGLAQGSMAYSSERHPVKPKGLMV